jgi:hypothetical protein
MMPAAHANQIISGYLSRLEVAVRTLPGGRRVEPLDVFREHIAEARASCCSGCRTRGRLATSSSAPCSLLAEALASSSSERWWVAVSPPAAASVRCRHQLALVARWAPPVYSTTCPNLAITVAPALGLLGQRPSVANSSRLASASGCR